MTTFATMLLVLLVFVWLGVLPGWTHSRTWGYGPGGAVGLAVLALAALLLTGRI